MSSSRAFRRARLTFQFQSLATRAEDWIKEIQGGSPFAPQKNFGEPQATVTETKTRFVDRTKKSVTRRRGERGENLIRVAVVARDLTRFYSVSSVLLTFQSLFAYANF